MNMYLKSKLVYLTLVLGMSCNMQIPTTFLTRGQLEALQLHMKHTHLHIHTHKKKISQEDQSAGHCKEITT